MKNMKTLRYQVSIDKRASEVYDIMLGITSKTTYEDWTKLFSPTSSYIGDWSEGSKMLFVSKDENGDLAGMVSRIDRVIPNSFVSIVHYGMLKSGNEITDGPEVDSWSGVKENYLFEENEGKTTVSIELDSAPEHEEYMNKLYPKALQKLREICELS